MINEDWNVVMSFFPKNWRWLAKRHKVLKGMRKDKNPEHFLRALLIHLGSGCSLRETSVRLRQANIVDISDVALLKRLRKSKDYLHALCKSLLFESGKPERRIRGREFRLFDSTVIEEQGPTGSLWRIHYSIRFPSLRCDFLKLTPVKGHGNTESFLQYPLNKGDYILADRGYSKAKDIHYASLEGARVCIRVNYQSLKLNDLNGNKFPLLERLEEALPEAGNTGEWDVLVPGKNGEAVPGRICALKKTAVSAERAQKKAKKRAAKDGAKIKEDTLRFAKYVVLFTTFPKVDFSTEEVLEGYRFRWQIELIFKRFKQIASLGHLPKKDNTSIEAWVYGKLFVAILTQRIIDYASSFSPWGYSLEKISRSKSLAGI